MSHVHELIDFTADVFIVYGKKVLMRKHEKYGIWLGVGGHVELDEDPNQAALREAKEEVGLEVELLPKPHELDYTKEPNGYHELVVPILMNRHRIHAEHEHVSMVFAARSDSDHVIPEQPTDEWKWMSREELLEDKEIHPSVVYCALKALDVVVAERLAKKP